MENYKPLSGYILILSLFVKKKDRSLIWLKKGGFSNIIKKEIKR